MNLVKRKTRLRVYCERACLSISFTPANTSETSGKQILVYLLALARGKSFLLYPEDRVSEIPDPAVPYAHKIYSKYPTREDHSSDRSPRSI